MSNNRLAKLLEKKQQLQAQIKDLESRQRAQDRKNDTRRKIIAGALALEHLEKNPESPFARTLLRLLDEYVTRPAERSLFNLPPPAGNQNTPPSDTASYSLSEKFPAE